MKYSEKHDRYIDSDYAVYRMNSKGKLVQCKLSLNNAGYLQTSSKLTGVITLHRLIWETFNGEIPDNMCIDHINTVKTDNRIENLRCVSYSENMRNPLTTEHLRNSKVREKNPMFGKKLSQKSIDAIRRWHTGMPMSDFGKKFKEHYGISYSQNEALYKREYWWFKKYGHCSWE